MVPFLVIVGQYAIHESCGRIHPLLNTLPETNSSHLKMDGLEPTFRLGFGLFSGANC